MQIGLGHPGPRGDGRRRRAAKTLFGEYGLGRLQDHPLVFGADR